MAAAFVSGSALFACDESLKIVEWNEGAERLLGISAVEAMGQPCWAVLRGRAEDGSLVCHRGCSGARLARTGWPVSDQVLCVPTPSGRRRVDVETVTSVGSDFRLLHVLRESHSETAEPSGDSQKVTVHLTTRQLDVLRLLAEGFKVRQIAARLELKEQTVRNHLHGIAVELGTHSQLQAVLVARRRGLL